VYGGVASGGQSQALRAPVDVVVATPGRLLDHLSCGAARFDGLEVLVLDEADRLLDMGFWPSVRRIVSALPVTRQTLFFSATMSPDVWHSAVSIMRDPRMIQIGSAGGPASTITHVAQHVPSPAEKASWLAQFLRRAQAPTLVFVRTKRGADRLARRLSATGIRCAPLHADRTQSQRMAAVEGFRAGRHTTLVATDIAARGLDIDGIGHVINFEPPDTPDVYVHRVGRTGRAEMTGTALTLVAPAEVETLRALERSLNIQLANGWSDEELPTRSRRLA
jgi:ATP-dependent RNA helicase RhlE